MPPDPAVAPDYVEPFIGWRCWGVKHTRSGVRLVSAGGTEWPTTTALEAMCRHNHGHDHLPPAEGCTCGVYALDADLPYYTFDSDDYRVFGEVFLYGIVVRGTQGFRAQRAWPKSLYVAHKDWRLAGPLREAYRVPVRLTDPFNFETKED
jgi:hypothetical protein